MLVIKLYASFSMYDLLFASINSRVFISIAYTEFSNFLFFKVFSFIENSLSQSFIRKLDLIFLVCKNLKIVSA